VNTDREPENSSITPIMVPGRDSCHVNVLMIPVLIPSRILLLREHSDKRLHAGLASQTRFQY